jgi:myo-inositol-1-phosphate synthase
MGKIKVAVAGVGNLCSALIQGVEYYSKSQDTQGLIHEKIGSYKIADINFVSAFDIDSGKIGKDLSEAIFVDPNTAPRFIDVPNLGVRVFRGPSPDNISEGALSEINKSEKDAVNVIQVLRDEKVDILLNMVSGGSDKASAIYAEACLDTGTAYLNATPSLIASDPIWIERFDEKDTPIVGDDLLDQVGATALHMGILEFLERRGVKVDESYQLDVGGGTESINTLERTREIKRAIKTKAVSRSVPYEFPLISGSTDFVDFLENARDSFFWFRGSYFCGAPFTIDIKLNTIDSTNGGAVLLDLIRGLKIAQDRNLGGCIDPLCAYGFKTGKRQSLVDTLKEFEEFIQE